MDTIKVKPWGEGQGDHVVINAEDFNPDIHAPLEAAEKPAEDAEKPKQRGKRAAAEKPAE